MQPGRSPAQAARLPSGARAPASLWFRRIPSGARVVQPGTAPYGCIQREVRKNDQGYYSTLDPHRIVDTIEEARSYDEKLSKIAREAITQLAEGGRTGFNTTIANAIEYVSPKAVMGEDPIETIFDWARFRYKGLARDMHKDIVLDQDTINITSAFDYVDTHLAKHSGILVDPTFMPSRNRTDFRRFLETQDSIKSIFDAWEGYRGTRPKVSLFRALNLPTSSGVKDIVKIGLMPSLVRNTLASAEVDFSALFYQPLGTQLMDRITQNNTGNQMLQSVTPTRDIAWLVGSSPEFTGSQNTSTNAVYNLSLEIPDIDLIRFNDFGRFADTVEYYGYQDISGDSHALTLDETEQFVYYPIAPKSITGSTPRAFTEKFPSKTSGFKFYR